MQQITGLLGRLGGEIELVLEQFHLSRPEAEEVLRDVLLPMAHRWDRLENRELWTLATLRRHCLRSAARRALPQHS
jgi:hypothetical protein